MITAGVAADPHRGGRVFKGGAPLARARLAVVMLHGRGGSPEDMLGLAEHFALPDLAYLAPEAAGRSWWPGVGDATLSWHDKSTAIFRRVKEGARMADTDYEAEVEKALDTVRAERREIIQKANTGGLAGPNLRTALIKVQEIQVTIDVLKQALADEKSCRQADTASMIAPAN